jgi:hypothetical protein
VRRLADDRSAEAANEPAGLPSAAIFYDAIPLRFPERYLTVIGAGVSPDLQALIAAPPSR